MALPRQANYLAAGLVGSRGDGTGATMDGGHVAEAGSTGRDRRYSPRSW